MHSVDPPKSTVSIRLGILPRSTNPAGNTAQIAIVELCTFFGAGAGAGVQSRGPERGINIDSSKSRHARHKRATVSSRFHRLAGVKNGHGGTCLSPIFGATNHTAHGVSHRTGGGNKQNRITINTQTHTHLHKMNATISRNGRSSRTRTFLFPSLLSPTTGLISSRYVSQRSYSQKLYAACVKSPNLRVAKNRRRRRRKQACYR